MGGGKIDLRSKTKRLEDAYPVDTPKGVHALLSQIHYIREGRFTRGDYDASILLIDFEQSMEEARLTARQRQIIKMVFELDLYQDEAANILGITQQAISDHVKTLVCKIARINKQKEELYVCG
ncbi:putative RNA polymerase, sigma 28 subunit, FliA/WhiG subfamily [Desulfofarcimen acetoxidans DSM 771]|uniref:Putative RNA polymerase, sigma 28 subunit, FliA/WhiG subfamily n=1 Tax=Desulfofarcimen acetoxidans (strain ATCC 49208 / DSM 771 / KCTC 5769 / VKM B-1644 / 5575) TaxID=485916 RepID=C8VXS6_DESAS|nr:sigma factor-like helix-turn-helix DNA-binding protein [Desulfofarcimen acetoxidans]ACV62732.1 putative RNA polymerase, sigma 28 subunit, FliA/WhiG subfamily [Desulfofarcimen acetoxidans DSM 771]